jgi:hypothetical protein
VALAARAAHRRQLPRISIYKTAEPSSQGGGGEVGLTDDVSLLETTILGAVVSSIQFDATMESEMRAHSQMQRGCGGVLMPLYDTRPDGGVILCRRDDTQTLYP